MHRCDIEARVTSPTHNSPYRKTEQASRCKRYIMTLVELANSPACIPNAWACFVYLILLCHSSSDISESSHIETLDMTEIGTECSDLYAHINIYFPYFMNMYFFLFGSFSLWARSHDRNITHTVSPLLSHHMAQSMREQKPSQWHFQLHDTFLHGLPFSTRQRSTEYVPLLCHYCKTHMLRCMSGKLRIEEWVPTDVPRVSFCEHSFRPIQCIEQWKEPDSSVRMSLLVTHWKKRLFLFFLARKPFLLRWRLSLHLSFMFLNKNCLSIYSSYPPHTHHFVFPSAPYQLWPH